VALHIAHYRDQKNGWNERTSEEEGSNFELDDETQTHWILTHQKHIRQRLNTITAFLRQRTAQKCEAERRLNGHYKRREVVVREFTSVDVCYFWIYWVGTRKEAVLWFAGAMITADKNFSGVGQVPKNQMNSFPTG
jgi:hypothetical protein